MMKIRNLMIKLPRNQHQQNQIMLINKQTYNLVPFLVFFKRMSTTLRRSKLIKRKEKKRTIQSKTTMRKKIRRKKRKQMIRKKTKQNIRKKRKQMIRKKRKQMIRKKRKQTRRKKLRRNYSKSQHLMMLR